MHSSRMRTARGSGRLVGGGGGVCLHVEVSPYLEEVSAYLEGVSAYLEGVFAYLEGMSTYLLGCLP